jgi:hypothetical protein
VKKGMNEGGNQNERMGEWGKERKKVKGKRKTAGVTYQLLLASMGCQKR